MPSFAPPFKPAALRLLAAALCAAVAPTACGGGGDSGVFLPVAPAPAPAAPPPATAPAPVAERSVQSVRLIGEQVLANDLRIDGVQVGGLSAVDYDPATKLWYFLSDDRTSSRFHTAELDYDGQRFSSVRFRSTIALKDMNGKVYPSPDPAPGGTAADPESFRIDPQGGGLWWGSEGDRARGLDPFVARMAIDGVANLILPAPAMFRMSPTQEKGSRNNATYEALSFSADGRSLWVGMEAPIYEDGPLPTPKSGAVSRFTQFDRAGAVLRQVAYPIDAIPKAPTGPNADNGVSEMLAINDHQFLVIERAGVQAADGNYSNYIRLYEIETEGATDVRGLASLVGADYKPVRKRLVLDLNTLGLARLDNIEGIAWGPKLPNGNDTLVLVSDNNFNTASQITQLLAFEVQPKK
ncbi:esterase-like activity of phytase family protein [Variovorax sp. UC122_21]|uniref:esterase-like activity of phytase family protein n=1 Tax=Variovorax sp. UC122_21 TaxID=3374554 RepID=UPI003756D170